MGGGSGADVLQEAMLPVADHKTCREKNERCGNGLQRTYVVCWSPGQWSLSGKKNVYLFCIQTNKFPKMRKIFVKAS